MIFENSSALLGLNAFIGDSFVLLKNEGYCCNMTDFSDTVNLVGTYDLFLNLLWCLASYAFYDL